MGRLYYFTTITTMIFKAIFKHFVIPIIIIIDQFKIKANIIFRRQGYRILVLEESSLIFLQFLYLYSQFFIQGPNCYAFIKAIKNVKVVVIITVVISFTSGLDNDFHSLYYTNCRHLYYHYYQHYYCYLDYCQNVVEAISYI